MLEQAQEARHGRGGRLGRAEGGRLTGLLHLHALAHGSHRGLVLAHDPRQGGHLQLHEGVVEDALELAAQGGDPVGAGGFLEGRVPCHVPSVGKGVEPGQCGVVGVHASLLRPHPAGEGLHGRRTLLLCALRVSPRPQGKVDPAEEGHAVGFLAAGTEGHVVAPQVGPLAGTPVVESVHDARLDRPPVRL